MRLILSLFPAAVAVAASVACSAGDEPGRCRLFLYRSAADFAPFGQSGARWDAAAGGLSAVGAGVATVASPDIPVDGAFDQLVVSWNTLTPPGSYVTLYAQARVGGAWSRRFTIGIWHRDGSAPERTSVSGQSDGLAKMDVDTLKLSQPADALRVAVELHCADEGASPVLRLLAIQTLNTKRAPRQTAPVAVARGMDLPVPELSQLSVPDGHAWCSPTCVAMVLRYWSKVLGRPELTVSIPEAVAGIHDKAHHGTGNWPFNTAYAAEFGGLMAYVDRFESLTQIERWVAAKVPVIASIDRNVLTCTKGKRMGHLVVVRGFTDDGQVILNDPWAPKGGSGVHVTYSRADFERSWLTAKGSYGTVYLIYPDDWRTPRGFR